MATETTTPADVIDVTTTAEDVVRAEVETFVRRDLDGMAALLADDVVIHVLPIDRELRGRNEVMAYFEEMLDAAEDLDFQIEAIHAVDQGAVMQWRLRCRFAGAPWEGVEPNGAEVDLRGCDVAEVADGRIVRVTQYWDSATWARQVGLMPPAGSRADEMLLKVFNARTKLKARLSRD